MDVINTGTKNILLENPENFLVQTQLINNTKNNDCFISTNFITEQLLKNEPKFNDIGDSLHPSNSTIEKMLCLNYNDQNVCPINPFKFSSIWVLLTKERNYKLLNLDDVDILLPQNGSSLMISRSFIVNMHFTPGVVDHYSKEISKILTKDDFLVNFNGNSIVSRISCLPAGSRVTFFVVNDEVYKSWAAGRSVERCELLVQSLDLKELLFELQNMKEMFKQSEENIKRNIIKYISLNEGDTTNIVEAVNYHMAQIDSASVFSEKISCGVANNWLIDAANIIKESNISVTSLVQCNNLLIAENANMCNKYEKLKMKLQYGDSLSKEEFSSSNEDFLSQSNEQLQFKLMSLLNHMEELQIKLHQSEQKNLTLSEQFMRMRLEKEQLHLKLNYDVSNHSFENVHLKKEIAMKDSVLKETVNSGRMLLEDMNSIENLFQSRGKDILQSISHISTLDDADALPYLMNTFRNCINDFSRTILAAHNKAESSERSLSQIKVEFSRVNEEFTNLNKEVCGLKEKLYLLNSENMELLNNVSELAEENSLIQEQLSQSNYRIILLTEQLNQLRIDMNSGEGSNFENKLDAEKTNPDFQENVVLKSEVDQLMKEKHELLERVHEVEASIKKYQYDLQHKDSVLNKTVQYYESFINEMKKEAIGKESELNNSQQMFTKFIEGIRTEHAGFVEQMKSLQMESTFQHCHYDQDDMKTQFDDGIKILKEVVQNFPFHLREESYENIGMRQNMEQLNNIQKFFSDEEINFDTEMENIIENECNEALIGELESCLNEKENLIKSLEAKGKSNKNEIKHMKEWALRWKKQLHVCKMLLKEFKDKNIEMVHGHNQLYQNLNKTIEKLKVKCDGLERECNQKTMEVANLEEELKESEKKYEHTQNSYDSDKGEIRKELNVARKRLLEYEKHVSVLDKELERQVKLVEKTVKMAAYEKKDLIEQIHTFSNEIVLLKNMVNGKEKMIVDLNQTCKNFENEIAAAKDETSEWKSKCCELEEIITEKKNFMKSLEVDKRKTEEMLVSYNRTASDLVKEQRKGNKLEDEVKLLSIMKNDLENTIKDKDNLLQDSFNDLQSLRKELAEVKNSLQKNSREVNKHHQEIMNLEHSLSKSLEEKKVVENSYRTLFNEKKELLKEHDTLCDKLINAIHMLMENKLVKERMEVQIKELSDTVSMLKRRKVSIEVIDDKN